MKNKKVIVSHTGNSPARPVSGLTVYKSPELGQLRQRVAELQLALAALESEYTADKSHVDFLQESIFRRLANHYRTRDLLLLERNFWIKRLTALDGGDQKGAKRAEANYKRARDRADRRYDEAAAAPLQKPMTGSESETLGQLWKKLVKLYHPDRFSREPEKLDTYSKMTSAINRAKTSGDLATLQAIAEDPHGFILRHGWVALDFSDEVELSKLRKLAKTLKSEIASVQGVIKRLRASPDYHLSLIVKQKPAMLDQIVAERAELIDMECAKLKAEVQSLADKVDELTYSSA